MYYIPIVILILFSYVERKVDDKKHILFNISFVMLTIMLCFRYGQGTDFYGYMGNYNLVDTHSEIGFLFISVLLKKAGVPFGWFVAGIALFEMGCVYRAIQLYSPLRIFSLLMFYPTLYLTYCFSGMRQGIVIMFFLGFMIKWLQDDKLIKYLIACMVLSTIHSAALILLPLIIIKKIKVQWLYWGVAAAFICGGTICVIPSKFLSFINIGAVRYYINNISISPFGLLERIVLFGLITYLMIKMADKDENGQMQFIYKIYICGFIISIAFFPWSLVSSRLAVMMKATEIILLPMLYKNIEDNNLKKILMVFLLMYITLMTTKNLLTYIQQGGYIGYNALTYPYLSVFNKKRANEIRKDEWINYIRMYKWYRKNKYPIR